jgi:SAM-dependent methyltransferase
LWVGILLGLLKKKRAAAAEEDAEAEEADTPEGETEDGVDAGSSRFRPILARLHAWWDGDDYIAVTDEDLESEAEAPPVAPDPEDAINWSPARCEVVQRLWGDGFSSPGEAEHVMMLVKPLGLDEKQSVLDLNPGLGGSTRVIAESTGSWVTGLESDADLVAAGMELSVKAGMAKKAAVELFTPPRIDLEGRAMDAVISKEALYAMPEKEILLEEIYKALKPTGQVLFTDYMLPTDDSKSAGLDAWLGAERPTPIPWSNEQTVSRLKDIGFEIRVNEDITDQVKSLVIKSWSGLIAGLKPGQVPKEAALAIVLEAEVWCRRLALFDANDLRCYRIHGLKHESGL